MTRKHLDRCRCAGCEPDYRIPAIQAKALELAASTGGRTTAERVCLLLYGSQRAGWAPVVYALNRLVASGHMTVSENDRGKTYQVNR